jgi:hypothetical protein
MSLVKYVKQLKLKKAGLYGLVFYDFLKTYLPLYGFCWFRAKYFVIMDFGIFKALVAAPIEWKVVVILVSRSVTSTFILSVREIDIFPLVSFDWVFPLWASLILALVSSEAVLPNNGWFTPFLASLSLARLSSVWVLPKNGWFSPLLASLIFSGEAPRFFRMFEA